MCREGAGSAAAYGGLRFLLRREVVSMYQALYRKWRPKTFSDVIGQSHITQTLQKQVAEGRTSHAYLFTGTRGTGKTTCAKILAKAVNCEHPVDGDPCSQCPSCRGHRKRQLSGCTGAGRRLQQRCGPGAGPAGRGRLRPRQCEKARVHRGRGPHALHRRPSTPC